LTRSIDKQGLANQCRKMKGPFFHLVSPIFASNPTMLIMAHHVEVGLFGV
jgi:hypothetical protein